jgi:lysophospholipase L1-like esterase
VFRLMQFVSRVLFRLRYELAKARRRYLPIPTGRVLWVWGHSYAAGNDDGVEPWPKRLARLLDLPLRNQAVPGHRIEATVPLAVIDRGRPDARDVVVVEAGVNDTVFYGDDRAAQERFQRDLANVVERLSSQGARVLVTIDGPLHDWSVDAPYDKGSDAACAAFLERARALDVPVVDVGTDPAEDGTTWDRATMLLPDKVHPNDKGAQHYASVVAAALRRHRLV